MAEEWKALRDALVSSVTERAGELLAANQPVKDKVLERAERLAQLAEEWVLAPASEKAVIEERMEKVRQTVENEVDALMLRAKPEAKQFVKAIAGTVFDTIIRGLPGLLRLLRRD